MIPPVFDDATQAWMHVCNSILTAGRKVIPRGLETHEVLHNTVAFNMLNPVVLAPGRKLNYSFMAAEALWIIDGDNRVETIAPYNKNIAAFSDDGLIFQGAYGPPLVSQLQWVVDQLRQDQYTRQAVLTIWDRMPAKSKDIPCTVALTFNIRDDKLNCHAFMRSSDCWLGVPYDFFNFSMIAYKVLHELGIPGIKPGNLYWTAVSSHLYEINRNALLLIQPVEMLQSIPVEWENGWEHLKQSMIACRDKSLTDGLWKIRQ